MQSTQQSVSDQITINNKPQTQHLHANEQSSTEVPGEPKTFKTSVLDVGSTLTQNFAPIHNFSRHYFLPCFYAHDMNRQVATHHYASPLNEDMWQAILYDSDKSDAKILGVEYVVTEKLFKDLPNEEKMYWHSHLWEVKGGLIVFPGVPNIAEHKVLEKVAKTYGKNILLWQVDRGDKLPIGPPQLMMSFTGDGQLNNDQRYLRDSICGTTMDESREKRKDIPNITLDPLADYWQTGQTLQFTPTAAQTKAKMV